MAPVVSIVGRSQSGKTTLIEKLIPELKKRGYTVGTIKHSHRIEKTRIHSRHHQAFAP
jgi:molybdopterin-guanine dinucleotide biosynthesis protein MobB